MATVDLTWTDNSTSEDGFYVYRTTTSSPTFPGDYTQIHDTGAADVTSYTDSNAPDNDTVYYAVTAYNSNGESSETTTSVDTSAPTSAPTDVSTTVNADDDITVSWTDNSTEETQYHVQISRDGGAFENVHTGGSTDGLWPADTTSVNIVPQSGLASGTKDYSANVGSDSSLQFRVRAENSAGNTTWTSGSTVYTTPIPPYDVTVNKPNSNEVSFSWTNKSTIYNQIELQYRVDAGSGFGSWTTESSSITGTSYTFSASDGNDYQFRLRTLVSDGTSSSWLYVDNGTTIFTDGFESGSTSNWDTINLGNSNSGVVDTTATEFSEEISPEGTWHLEIVSSNDITKNLGDLSSNSDIVVRAKVQTATNDNDSEAGGIEWYNGSSWSRVGRYGWEHDQGDWFETTILIDNTELSTDNRLRLEHNQGGGVDYVAFDEIRVSELQTFTLTSAAVNLSGTGTVVTSGTGTIGIIRDFAGTALISTTGVGSLNVIRNFVGSGSVVTTGTSTLNRARELTASGQTVLTGTATVERIRSLVGSGTVVINGSGSLTVVSQDTILLVATGTVSTVGDGSIGILRRFVGNGSITTTGVGTQTRKRGFVGSGDTVIQGSADTGIIRSFTGAGDVFVSGTSVLSAIRNLSASGSTRIQGVGNARKLVGFTADGVVEVAGSGTLQPRRLIEGTGTVTTEGTASTTIVRYLSADGSTTVTVDAELTKILGLLDHPVVMGEDKDETDYSGTETVNYDNGDSEVKYE